MKAAMLRSMALVLAVLAGGCGDDDDGFNPTIETVAGSYTASTFTIEDETGTIDLLALDASVSATLNEDGTTTGQLFVPEGDEDGSDLEADLAGTWTLEGDTLTKDD
jgi:hypothetical protein